MEDLDFIKECIQIKDGELYWKFRPLEHFQTLNAWATWNSRLSNSKIGTVTKNSKGIPAVVFGLNGKRYYYHRVLWALHHDRWPDGVIDHRDQNPLNNTIDNLLDSNYVENGKNRKLGKNSSTGIIGVTFSRKGNYFSFLAKGWDGIEKKWRVILSTKDFFEACCARKSWELGNGYSCNHGRKLDNPT